MWETLGAVRVLEEKTVAEPARDEEQIGVMGMYHYHILNGHPFSELQDSLYINDCLLISMYMIIALMFVFIFLCAHMYL